MLVKQLSLARQVDIVFYQIKDELIHLSSGIIFIQIRSNTVGKFGVKHDPIESKDVDVTGARQGLTEAQFQTFRQMAIQSLKHKKHWTHGEISFEFALKLNKLVTSIQLESNYNMANLLTQPDL